MHILTSKTTLLNVVSKSKNNLQLSNTHLYFFNTCTTPIYNNIRLNYHLF